MAFTEEGNKFALELNELVTKYAKRGILSNAECLGILKLMGDDISAETRKPPDIGPHPLS